MIGVLADNGFEKNAKENWGFLSNVVAQDIIQVLGYWNNRVSRFLQHPVLVTTRQQQASEQNSRARNDPAETKKGPAEEGGIDDWVTWRHGDTMGISAFYEDQIGSTGYN